MLRGLALPLFVEGDNLVVRGGDGDSTRLPLTGDGAVAALSPYRYSTSTRSVERGQGSHFWWWVGKWRRGQPSPAHSVTTETDASMSLPAEAGFSAGKWRDERQPGRLCESAHLAEVAQWPHPQ